MCMCALNQSRNSLSRENINFPEDEVTGGAEDVDRREHSPGTVIPKTLYSPTFLSLLHDLLVPL